MNTLELRSKIQNYVEQLSEERLLVAVDFLAYLAERDNEDATEELLKINDFTKSFEEAKKNVEEGKVIPVEQLKRKY